MGSTIYKRRSINLDDKSYKRGKLLAKSQTVSLSALLRLLINGAYSSYCPGVMESVQGDAPLGPELTNMFSSSTPKEVEGAAAEATLWKN
jgi:hypothetical protein